MSGQIPEEHRQQAPATVRCAVITVSDTRTLQTDSGGQTAVDLLVAAGHRVTAAEIIADEPEPMQALLASLCRRDDVDAILMTGGTGLGSRDQTFETVGRLLDKPCRAMASCSACSATSRSARPRCSAGRPAD